MGGKSNTCGPGPGQPIGTGADEVTRILNTDRTTGRQPTAPPDPHDPPTEVMPQRPLTEVVPPRREAGVVRYGPGVPFSLPEGQGGHTAEHVWRAGQRPASRRRWRALRRLVGSALSVILLTAAGVALYLRFHQPPFQVTGVVIAQETRTACGVDVTGRVTTNGAAGTISYQWLFRPGRDAPQPLSQSVTAGQHAAYVTVTVQGSGHGSTSQTVTLQVLGPDRKAASATVPVSC